MTSHFNAALVRAAAFDAFKRLSPRAQWRNPVMALVWLGSVITTVLWLRDFSGSSGSSETAPGFVLALALWLWFTVLFANFAEALAEGRGRAQAAALRGMRGTTQALRLDRFDSNAPDAVQPSERVNAAQLRKGELVRIEAGEVVPADGEILYGAASVDESAITGESAPVIRAAGGDVSAVTGGTRLLSDWLVVRVANDPGESFLDRMIAMVEGAQRQKTPNEIALTLLLVGLTLSFLVAVATLLPFSRYAVDVAGAGAPIPLAVLIALLVCLIPTTIGGLLSAIGVAGMGRMMAQNVLATSGRAIEAAGDVDVLLLDKTGTITLGNRQATRFLPLPGVSDARLADAARRASHADVTPEGRSIVALADNLIGASMAADRSANFIAFTAQTRMSGVDDEGVRIRKGAADAVRAWIESSRGIESNGGPASNTGPALNTEPALNTSHWPAAVDDIVDSVARRGATPLVVAESAQSQTNQGQTNVLGVVELKDIVKPGLRERFGELRRMGIATVMITGDNRTTAAAIAAEAGVDDFIAGATPETKLARIRAYQDAGHLVAMTGDGTNDAPALAQADVAVAMASGTQAAREAGNLVDLDSDPTKLIAIVETGKQMLVTRGALTTFSIANDVAKYFAILPAAFAGTYPALDALDLMQLASPQSAILSAVIFNALVIVALIPLALKGVRSRALDAAGLLRRNLLVYGLGGLVVPFAGIKAIDLLLSTLGWV